MNNESNNCGACGTTCSECGRPWAICKQEGGCGCKKCGDIRFCEYGKKACGCIRNIDPTCPLQAVIPAVVVEDASGLKRLADCFVHVDNINTTFYIDDKHRAIITWAGPVEANGYDYKNNPLNLRNQTVYDFENNIAIYYSKSGKYRLITLSEEQNG